MPPPDEPNLADLWVEDCVFTSGFLKVSSKGFRQKRAVVVRKESIVVASAERGEWNVSRVVKFKDVSEVFSQGEGLVVKILDSFDLMMVFGDTALAQGFLRSLPITIPTTVLQPSANLKSHASLAKTPNYQSPTQQILSRPPAVSAPPPPLPESVVIHKPHGVPLGIELSKNLIITGFTKGTVVERDVQDEMLGGKLCSVASNVVRKCEDVENFGVDSMVCTVVYEKTVASSGTTTSMLQSENDCLKEMLQVAHGQIDAQSTEIDELRLLTLTLGEELESRPTAVRCNAETNTVETLPPKIPTHDRCEYRFRIVQKEKQNLREAITTLKQQIVVLQQRLSGTDNPSWFAS